MEDKFLKEQLQRIRSLSERLSETYDRLSGQPDRLAEELAHAGPLHRVRDYRPLQTYDYSERIAAEPRRKPRPHTVTARRRRRS